MGRVPREIVAGGIYHVWVRGNDRQPIFRDDTDRWVYLTILSEVATKFKWQRLAHCLMTNHVHLLLETPEPNLSVGMHRLQWRYANRFNRRHGKSGHLFERRFGANRIKTDKQLVAATSYIAMNPVEAGLCDVPEQWPWSEYSAANRRVNAIYAPTPRKG